MTLVPEDSSLPRSVELSLSPEQYRQAGEAHLHGWRISVNGALQRIGRKWHVLDIAGFEVLESTP